MIKKFHFKIIRIAVIIITIISLILISIFLIIHFRKFHDPVSSKLSDWSDFGSYFGGTVGVILSALNFLVISYLTIKIHRNHDQQWLTQLRVPFYKDIIEKTYRLTDKTIEDKNELQSFISWLEHTDFKNLLFLVETHEKMTLAQKKNTLLETLKHVKSKSDINEEANKELINTFNTAKNDFAEYLGKIMMNQTK